MSIHVLTTSSRRRSTNLLSRSIVSIGAIAAALTLAGCGSSEEAPPVMPDVTGLQLDVALSDIERAGTDEEVEIVGGGMFGVQVEANWTVCEQLPLAGEPISVVPRLTVDRTCEADGEPTAEATPTPTEAATPEATTEITPEATTGATSEPPLAPAAETTVDELISKINSADMGGLSTGDRFHLVGQLTSSPSWGTGVTGDYTVYLKGSGEGNDLLVWVNESDVSGATDGTQVDMVVSLVDATINGETTGGWLRADSVTILP